MKIFADDTTNYTDNTTKPLTNDITNGPADTITNNLANEIQRRKRSDVRTERWFYHKAQSQRCR